MLKAFKGFGNIFIFKQEQKVLKTLESKVSLMEYVTVEVRPGPSAFSI